METSSSEQKKIYSKTAEVIPSCYHLDKALYCGWVQLGSENFYTYWYSTKEEAAEKLKCLKEITKFDSVETTQDEGCFPERAKLLEEKYQASGRTNSLYTGLMLENAEVH